MGEARRLVDEYLAKSVSASKLPLPRLRDVPSARRLYEGDARTRLSVAIECGRRLAWETSHAYVVTSIRQGFTDRFLGRLSWAGLKLTASNWLTRLRQGLLSRRYGMSRLILNHHGRYERLFRIADYDARNDLRRLSEAGRRELVENLRGRAKQVRAWLEGSDLHPFSATRLSFSYMLIAYSEAGGTD